MSPTEQKLCARPYGSAPYQDTKLERVLSSVGSFIGKGTWMEQFFIGVCFIAGLCLLVVLFPFLILLGFTAPRNQCNAQNMGKTGGCNA